MDKVSSRLILMVGTITYIAATVLALLTYVANAPIFSFVTLTIAVQVALGLPLLAMLFMGASFPALDYSKWLALLVSVLAIGGYLGIPRGAHEQSQQRLAFEAEQSSLAEDMGELEKLELELDLAKASSDGDKKELREKIGKVGDDLSKEKKEELQRDAAALSARQKIERFKGASRAAGLKAGENRNGLIILGAFLILAGAFAGRNEAKQAA